MICATNGLKGTVTEGNLFAVENAFPQNSRSQGSERWCSVFLFSGKVGPPAFFCVQSLYMLRKNQKSTRFPCRYTEEKLADSLSDCSGLCFGFHIKSPKLQLFKDQFSVESETESVHFCCCLFLNSLWLVGRACIGWIFEPARITVPWSILGPLTYRLPSLEASVLKPQRNIYACQYLSVDFISLWSSWFWV